MAHIAVLHTGSTNRVATEERLGEINRGFLLARSMLGIPDPHGLATPDGEVFTALRQSDALALAECAYFLGSSSKTLTLVNLLFMVRKGLSDGDPLADLIDKVVERI